jgi:hypothetical protein
MGSSFPVLRPVPVAAGAGHLLMKKAPRDGVPGRSEYEIRRPRIDQCSTIPLMSSNEPKGAILQAKILSDSLNALNDLNVDTYGDYDRQRSDSRNT